MSDVSWFYAIGEEQRGPVDEAALEGLIRDGEVGPETLVWRDGMEGWAAARSSLPGGLIPQSWVDALPPTRQAPPPMHDGASAYGAGDQASGAYDHPTQFVDVIRTVFSRYVLFQGRARRSEY